MEQSDERRIAYALRSQFIQYDRADYLLEEVGDIYRAGKTPRPKCMLLSGAPGSGKSMIFDEALRLHGCQEGTLVSGGRKQWPFFGVVLPPMSDIKPLYGRILTVLGIPHSLDDKPAFLHEQTCVSLDDAGTVLLGLDEIHNVLATKRVEECMTALRDITNRGIALFCAGIESARNVISADAQMANRFRCHRLGPWRCDDDSRDFLATLETRLPLREPSGLASKQMHETIVNRTQGHLGKMVVGVREAARDGIRNGTERIDQEALELSMDRLLMEGHDVFA